MDEATRARMEAYKGEMGILKARWEGDETDWEAALQVAEMYWEVGLYDRAVPWYEKALAAHEVPDLKNDLGFAQLLAGDVAGSVATLEGLTRDHPAYARGWLAYGVTLLHGVGDEEGARRALEEAVALDSGGEIGSEAARLISGLSDG